ncbi:MAG: tRNA preQ1(34) S-adenosylmethionine ribosyltransferase-isomerase QueA [Gemmatimonadetes bacterium]|nr:tRNA preQ1(34) S-adenosylmethionine ribosyltransferase-isomerase QueA [Gemmatimonadota bacterium]
MPPEGPLFDYELPPELIARFPSERRSDSRLLVWTRSSGEISHRRFRDLPELLSPTDLLVVNNSRVVPARLVGRKPTGATAEVLLLRPANGADPRLWEAMVRPGRKLRPGRVVVVSPEVSVRIVGSAAKGGRLVRIEGPLSVREALDRHGKLALPPYLGRDLLALDWERYQTVYASRDGSVAAPTAGLHFSRELLAEIEARGVQPRALTLHVGASTFRPIKVADPGEHALDHEEYEVSEDLAEAYGRCRHLGGRVWAVGTTVVRTLESVAEGRDRIGPGAGRTDLFVRPPHTFRAVDCLITNFHLPRSTLLMLVAAFVGLDATRRIYEEAIRRRYRFYSYGDAMAVIP